MKYAIALFASISFLCSCTTNCNRSDVVASYKRLTTSNKQLLSRLTDVLGQRMDSIESIEYYDYLYIVSTSEKGVATRYEEGEFKMKYGDIAFVCDLMKENALQVIRTKSNGLQLESSCGGELHPRIVLSARTTTGVADKTVEVVDEDWAIISN